jgi:phosphoglycolate phosphatase
MNFQSITLDLDGTLVDSALDLTLACQGMLSDLGEPTVSESDVRSFVGEGMANLVSRCLSRSAPITEHRLAEGVAAFQVNYRRLNGSAAKLYPGVRDALNTWFVASLPMACVTNKPIEFTQVLLEKLDLTRYFTSVVGGDTCEYKKPHPEPILHACREMGVLPTNNLHIGDSRHDITAARAAECSAGGVPYGYNGGKPLLPSECDLFFADLTGFLLVTPCTPAA